jgi:hypothetical protein
MGKFSLKKLVTKRNPVAGAIRGGIKAAKGDWKGASDAFFKEGIGGNVEETLNLAGIPWGDEPTRPDAGDPKYLGTAEGTAAENLRRAYDAADQAKNYQTQGKVRDPSDPREIQAERIAAATTFGPELENAQQINRQDLPDKVQQVNAPQLGATKDVEAVNLERAERIGQTQVGKAADASGAGQMLRDAAMGGGPSKAQEQLRAGLDEIGRKQMSMAAAARGSERRGARRGAMLAMGDQGSQLNQQLAVVRAGEQQQARGEFAQYSQRAQALEQDANNLQAQIDAARAKGDADTANQLAAQQASMLAQARQINAGAANARDSERAAYEARAGEQNAAAQNTRDVQQATFNQQADTFNAGAINNRASERAQMTQAWREAEAARQQAAATQNAANTLTASGRSADLGQRADDMRQRADTENIRREQEDQRIRSSGTAAAAASAATAGQQQFNIGDTRLKSDAGYYKTDKEQYDKEADAFQGRVEDAAVKYLTMGSDRRLKTDVKPVPKDDAERLADAYTDMVSTYRYKGGDSTTAGGMAQELEKDPLGKKFVHEDEDGMRSVDYNGLNAVALAGLAAKVDAQAQRTSKQRRTV